MYGLQIMIHLDNPLGWRRVILPSGLTFKKLHEVIELTFQKNELKQKKIYAFELEYGTYITNEQVKKKASVDLDSLIKTRDSDPIQALFDLRDYSQKSLRPGYIKIDPYLIDDEYMNYYDLTEELDYEIQLEKEVDDYDHPYPILQDGVEMDDNRLDPLVIEKINERLKQIKTSVKR